MAAAARGTHLQANAGDESPGEVAFAEVLVEGPAADEPVLVLPGADAGSAMRAEAPVERVENVEDGNRAARASGEKKRGGRQRRVVLDPPGEQKAVLS